MSEPWRKVFDADTPKEALPRIANELALDAMASLLQQLNADATYTDSERCAILIRAWPLVRDRTFTEIENAWLCSRDGGPDV